MATTSPAARGVALMLAGTLLLTLQDAVSKWLIDEFHVGEILFYRGLWAFVPIAWFASRAGGWVALRSRRPGANILRALLNTASGLAVISAYAYMPLADAMAIMFASPIVLAALSVPLLGEAVGWRRWSAVLVGFVGVLIMVRPGSEAFRTVAILPLAGAVFIALRDVLSRTLGAIDGTTAILFYTVSVTVIVGAVSLPVFGTTWPSLGHWVVFALLGLLNGVAHYMTIRAFALAEAVVLAPLRYLSLIWAAFIGFVVWSDVPELPMITGAALVVASGIYIILREARGHGRA